MARAKFNVGEAVEMRCTHQRDGQRAVGWLPGRVVHADARMVAVVFAVDVFANTGWPVPDRTLWCTHGSQNLRRALENAPQPPAAAAAPGRAKQGRGPGHGDA